MSRVELLEAQGNAWGLVLVIVLLAAWCLLWQGGVIRLLLELHRRRMAVVRRSPEPTPPTGASWTAREDPDQ